jgi:hypothetical protein
VGPLDQRCGILEVGKVEILNNTILGILNSEPTKKGLQAIRKRYEPTEVGIQ